VQTDTVATPIIPVFIVGDKFTVIFLETLPTSKYTHLFNF